MFQVSKHNWCGSRIVNLIAKSNLVQTDYKLDPRVRRNNHSQIHHHQIIGAFNLMVPRCHIITLFAASSQQYFSLTPNQHQPPANQQYFSLTINQHQPPATAQRTEWIKLKCWTMRRYAQVMKNCKVAATR